MVLNAPLIGISYSMDYTLFKPTSIHLCKEYPELKRIDEFKDLSKDDMLFVWHVANATSPISRIEDLKQRRIEAYKKVWGQKETAQLSYVEGRYGDKVSAAIDRMKAFVPSVRMRAKLMLEKTMDDFENIVHQDISNVTDPGEIKKYTDLRMDIANSLKTIISQFELGFGITTDEEEKDDDRRKPSFHDKVMDYQ